MQSQRNAYLRIGRRGSALLNGTRCPVTAVNRTLIISCGYHASILLDSEFIGYSPNILLVGKSSTILVTPTTKQKQSSWPCLCRARQEFVSHQPLFVKEIKTCRHPASIQKLHQDCVHSPPLYQQAARIIVSFRTAGEGGVMAVIPIMDHVNSSHCDTPRHVPRISRQASTPNPHL